jgi:hypothetical protein
VLFIIVARAVALLDGQRFVVGHKQRHIGPPFVRTNAGQNTRDALLSAVTKKSINQLTLTVAAGCNYVKLR